MSLEDTLFSMEETLIGLQRKLILVCYYSIYFSIVYCDRPKKMLLMLKLFYNTKILATKKIKEN
jgi:hypothetical protein